MQTQIRLLLNYSLNLHNHSDSLSGSQMNTYIFMEYRQGSHSLEKYLNLEGFLEMSLKIKSALKTTGKSLKSLDKSLNSTIFCRT